MVTPDICALHWLGQIPYQAAWDLQNELAVEIGTGHRPPTLLLLEHPHTYTFGRRGHLENLLWDEAERARRGVAVYWVDRGGDVTYHGPGQLVGYPLLPLAPLQVMASQTKGSPHLPQADYIGYLRRLEQVLIQALAQLGLAAGRLEGLTGVWVPDAETAAPPDQDYAKIAAIGVKVDAGGITRHGFALNVDPDMAYWKGIIGCGLADHPVTSLAEWLDPMPSLPVVISAVCEAFSSVFGYTMQRRTLEQPAARSPSLSV